MAYFGKVLRNYSDMAFGTVAQNGSYLSEVPRLKFQFAVEFVPSIVKTSSKKNWFNLFKELSLTVQSVDLPSHQFDIQVLNQYNRKRIVQTKVNWNPINITFLDTRDNKFQKVLTEYFKWSYREGREQPLNFGAGSQVPDIVTSNPRIHDFGYQTPGSFHLREDTSSDIQPNTEDSNALSGSATHQTDYEPYIYDKYFFSRIVIHRYTGGRLGPASDPVEIMNPVIMSINHDTLNYSDSSPIQWSVTFGYEGINYPETLGSNDDRLNGLWSRSKDFFGDTFGSKGSQTNTTKTDPVNEANNEFEAAI